MIMLSGIVQVRLIEQNSVGLSDQELTEHTAARRKYTAELWLGGEMPSKTKMLWKSELWLLNF